MIVKSMLDNDLYKFTMMQAVLHQFPGAMVEYTFKCRTKDIDFRPYTGDIIKNINRMCNELAFTDNELEYMSKLRFIKDDFVQFLKLFRFDYKYVFIRSSDNGDLYINVKGPWLHTILFEVPILAIVSEIYSKEQSMDYDLANKRTYEKTDLINESGLKFADFGTRRRHSMEAQINALRILMERCPESLVGTSNVLLAKELNLLPIGTMAHEWLQAHQALGYILAESQSKALENWAKEYRGDLGIALSDVIGVDYFLKDFDMYFAKLFDGTRQDSGDPYAYANKMIKHYKMMGIQPRNTKTIVFSDGLDFEKATKLWYQYVDAIRVSFGIGTHITNDFGFKPLQIVMKMTQCNGQPVAKLSDSSGKSMCKDEGYVEYLRRTFDRKLHKK